MENDQDLKQAHALLRDAYRYLTLAHPESQDEEADEWRNKVVKHIYDFCYSRDPRFKVFADKIAEREGGSTH